MQKFQFPWLTGFIMGFLLMYGPSFIQAQGMPSGSGTTVNVPGVRPQADNSDRDQIARDREVSPQQRMQHEAEQDRRSGGAVEPHEPGHLPSSPMHKPEMKERSPVTEEPGATPGDKSNRVGS